MSLFPYPNQRFTSRLGLALYGQEEVIAENFLLLDAAYGAGSSINVDGTLVESPNLSSTLPIAPIGDTLVTFQFDSNGNISAYVPTAIAPILPVTKAAIAHEWLNSYTAGTGLFTATQPVVADLGDTPAANTVLAGPTSGPAATATFRALVAADIPAAANLPLWSNLQNAAADLTLANAGYKTTFNQTSAVAWTWANTTAAAASVGTIAFVTKGIANTAVTLNTTGATLLVALLEGYTVVPTISDNKSNVWNYLTTYTSGNTKVVIAYAYGVTVGSGHIFTVPANVVAFVYAFSGTDITSAVFDSQNGTSTPQTSPFQVGSITPSTGDVVISGFAIKTSGTTASIDSGFSTADVVSGLGAAAYLLGAANSPLNPTWTTNVIGANCVPATACFRQSATPTNQSSPILTLGGTYWNASVSAADTWTIQDVIPNLTNGTSTLTLAHSGTSGYASVSVPNLALPSGGELAWNSDAGISRLGAASLAIGNGTAGNVTGNLSFNRVNLAGADYAGQATVTAGATTKAVTFAANYVGTAQPVIVLTPTSDPLALGVPVGYWVTYSGGAGAWTGFTVNIQTTLAGDVTFNYIVIGKA